MAESKNDAKSKNDLDTNQPPDIDFSSPTEQKASKKQTFADTATAAKLSGVFHQSAGKVKQRWGQYTDNAELTNDGRKQEAIGKIHRLVGNVRELRQEALTNVLSKRKEAQDVCIKHGLRVVDVAADFISDMKKVLFK